jgi:hypothetical protein
MWFSIVHSDSTTGVKVQQQKKLHPGADLGNKKEELIPAALPHL